MRSLGDAQCARDCRRRIRHCGRIIGHGMGQHDGVGFGMRQIERAAECVAKLVMKCHADRAETGTAQPRAVERLRARIAIVRLRHENG